MDRLTVYFTDGVCAVVTGGSIMLYTNFQDSDYYLGFKVDGSFYVYAKNHVKAYSIEGSVWYS